MTISDKSVKAKKFWYCDDCRTVIEPGTIYRRLYGAGCDGDPPYVLRLCVRCAPKRPM